MREWTCVKCQVECVTGSQEGECWKCGYTVPLTDNNSREITFAEYIGDGILLYDEGTSPKDGLRKMMEEAKEKILNREWTATYGLAIIIGYYKALKDTNVVPKDPELVYALVRKFIKWANENGHKVHKMDTQLDAEKLMEETYYV